MEPIRPLQVVLLFLVPRPHASGNFQIFSILSSLHSACVKRSVNILKTDDQRSFTCSSGCDADVAPAHMVLGKIEDQKQKCNLEWPNSYI